MTEVNEPNQHNEHDNDNEQERGAGVPAGLSVPVLLVATADVIMRGGLPEPSQVEVSARWGLSVDLVTHSQLRVWADRFGLAAHARSSQSFVRDDGVVCQLTNLYGRWWDADVRLHCLEPIDAIAALRDGVER